MAKNAISGGLEVLAMLAQLEWMYAPVIVCTCSFPPEPSCSCNRMQRATGQSDRRHAGTARLAPSASLSVRPPDRHDGCARVLALPRGASLRQCMAAPMRRLAFDANMCAATSAGMASEGDSLRSPHLRRSCKCTECLELADPRLLPPICDDSLPAERLHITKSRARSTPSRRCAN